MRISHFLSGGSNADRRTKKAENKNSRKSLPKVLRKINYIEDLKIPELDAILEDDMVLFRVMVLCNQVEALFIDFFEMVNYHIENSIEYDARGVSRVIDLIIQEKTVSNLSRLVEFLEVNNLPYNRHIVAVLIKNKMNY